MTDVALLSPPMRHSGNDTNTEPFYMGTGLVNGVLCHQWLDGTVLPVLTGGDGDGDDGSDDGGDDGDDGDGEDDSDDDDSSDDGGDDGSDDDDDDEDDDDDAALDKITDADKLRTMLKGARNTAQKASRQAAKYRTQRNSARSQRDTEKTRADDAEAKLAAGNTDETTKATIAQLTKERDEARAELTKLSATQAEQAAERQVSEEMSDLGIAGDADYAIVKLKKAGLYKLDEDGEVEDLTANLKKLVRKGVLTKKSTRGGNGTSGVNSGRTNPQKRSKPTDKVDRTALAKKYPALQR